MQWEYVGQLAEKYAELQEEAIELAKEIIFDACV